MYTLHYDHASLVDNPEPSRFLKHIEGEVFEFVGDDGKEVSIGAFSVFILDRAAILNEQDSLFDAFDYDGRMLDYFEHLYGREGEFRPKVLRAMKADMILDLGLLVLDRLELAPERRGRGIGLQVLRWMVHHFSMGCGVAAMKPYPLQFEGGTPEEREANENDEAFRRLRLGDYDRRFKSALRKLQHHYAKLGFAKVPGTPFMVVDLSRPLPSLKAMG